MENEEDEELPLDPLKYTDDPAELADRAGIRRDRGTRLTEQRREAIDHGPTDGVGGGSFEPQPELDE